MLRQVTLEQPDFMWQYMLKYERDIVSQSEVWLFLYYYYVKIVRENVRLCLQWKYVSQKVLTLSYSTTVDYT